MSDETVCVCGCTEREHDFGHEKSYYPEFRSVETWRACKAHGCMNVRPVLPWPDAEGWWWCDDGRLLYSDADLDCWQSDGGLWNRPDFEKQFGPARFTRLLEENPFREKK